MKKIVAIIVVICTLMASSSVFATDISEGINYKISGHLSPGDFIVISTTGGSTINFDNSNYDIESYNFEGYLFTVPKEMQVVEKAKIRVGPGKSFDKVGKLKAGDVVKVIGIFYGIDTDWDWYLLEDGTYVSEEFLDDMNDYVEKKEEDISWDFSGTLFDAPQKKQAIQLANIRSGPGMKYDIVRTLNGGDCVTVIGICDGVDCGWEWYLLDDGTYVSAHLLQ